MRKKEKIKIEKQEIEKTERINTDIREWGIKDRMDELRKQTSNERKKKGREGIGEEWRKEGKKER